MQENKKNLILCCFRASVFFLQKSSFENELFLLEVGMIAGIGGFDHTCMFSSVTFKHVQSSPTNNEASEGTPEGMMRDSFNPNPAPQNCGAHKDNIPASNQRDVVDLVPFSEAEPHTGSGPELVSFRGYHERELPDGLAEALRRPRSQQDERPEENAADLVSEQDEFVRSEPTIEPETTYQAACVRARINAYRSAFQLAKKAAEAGYAPAMKMLSDMYRHGDGTETNAFLAEYWQILYDSIRSRKMAMELGSPVPPLEYDMMHDIRDHSDKKLLSQIKRHILDNKPHGITAKCSANQDRSCRHKKPASNSSKTIFDEPLLRQQGLKKKKPVLKQKVPPKVFDCISNKLNKSIHKTAALAVKPCIMGKKQQLVVPAFKCKKIA